MNLLSIALSQYGLKEILGKIDNPEITKYFTSCGFTASALRDETSWCSAFVNWCAQAACKPMSGKLNARSWLTVGAGVADGQQRLGDVVVFWRGAHKDELITGSNLKKGHVGFYIREDAQYVYVLGGNQSNQVSIAPYAKNRVLNYRRL